MQALGAGRTLSEAAEASAQAAGFDPAVSLAALFGAGGVMSLHDQAFEAVEVRSDGALGLAGGWPSSSCSRPPTSTPP